MQIIELFRCEQLEQLRGWVAALFGVNGLHPKVRRRNDSRIGELLALVNCECVAVPSASIDEKPVGIGKISTAIQNRLQGLLEEKHR